MRDEKRSQITLRKITEMSENRLSLRKRFQREFIDVYRDKKFFFLLTMIALSDVQRMENSKTFWEFAPKLL